MSEVQAILEGTSSGVNLLIIGRLSKANTGVGVLVIPGGIEVESRARGGGKYDVLRKIAVCLLSLRSCFGSVGAFGELRKVNSCSN